MADGSGTSFNPSIFTRHLEELEELQSGGSSFEETTNYNDDDSNGEPSMEWRRQLVEEATTRVKQARTRTLDATKVYDLGTLLFDPDEGKFARVKSSETGHLVVVYLRGGETTYDASRKGKKKSTKASNGGSAQGTKTSSAAKERNKAGATRTSSATKNRASTSEVNAFIKKNYKSLSNRELARQLGLSEHTIRRKLGEWGLKRVKR